MSELREVIYRLTLDLVRETDACIYGLKVGETGSRVLKITLLENGSAYNIDSGITPRLRIKKPDNTIVYADCTVENNIITFDLSAHQQIYAAAGVAEAALELCSNEKAFVSCPFKIIIENQVVSNEEIESSDDFAALKKMEGKINEAYNTSIQAQNNLDKLENKVASVEQIPRNIKVWLDTTSYDKPTVMISCDVLDKFLDPTVAENDAYRLPIEVSKDRIGNHTVYLNSNLSAEFVWSLSEIKYSDSIAVCCYQIELTGAGEPIPIIRHFYPYSNESMLEQYILPLEAKIDSKKDMFHIAETSSLIDETDEYGNNFLDVKVDSGSENSTLQKDGNGCIAVNTDVIADKDYVNSLVSGAVKRAMPPSLDVVTIPDSNTIYMIPATDTQEDNVYNELMWIDNKWELIGSTAVDLSGYATLDDFETKENKLVGGNAITISEVENAGEKRTVVSVDSTSVVLRGQYDTEMATKANSNEVANAIKGNATGTVLLLEDVSPIAHKVTVISGMANSSVRAINSGNIITLPYEAGNKTEGGITFTYNADGSITLNGTTSNRLYAYLRRDSIPLTLPSGTYYMKTKVISGSRTGGATWQCVVDSTYATSSFTLTEAKNVAIRLDINQATATDVTYDNYTFIPILCAENKVPENYLAGTLDVEYTLDDNGLIELDSILPNMTILADNEVAIEYNKDASKLVNRLLIDNEELKSAVIALGGTLNV